MLKNKMRKLIINESGFGAVEIIISILILGLIGTVGWLVWVRQDSPSLLQQPTSDTSQVTENELSETVNTPSKPDDVLHNEEFKTTSPISLKTTSDVDKLPTYTPVSFSNYMREKLTGNDSHGCGYEAIVTIISLNTIAGSTGGTVYNSSLESCEGDGIGIVWYLDASGKWHSVDAMDACTGVNEGIKISASFMKKSMHDTCSAFTDTKY